MGLSLRQLRDKFDHIVILKGWGNVLSVIGLGSGSAKLLSLGAIEAMNAADEIYLRTEKHPTCVKLKELGFSWKKFDDLYENAENFDEVYSSIVDKLHAEVASGKNVVYVVPGHPCVGEKSVTMLRDKGLEFTIMSAVSFIDSCLIALGIDPLEGLLIIDGARGVEYLEEHLNVGVSTLISQAYNRMIMSDIKLALCSRYPDDYEVTIVTAAEVSGEQKIIRLPLYELDREDYADHLTSVYVPALDDGNKISGKYPADRLVNIMELLRSSKGCPWDRQQTMDSLKQYLIEETYEVIEAIEEENPLKHVDELGDLLLQIVFQAQIASEKEEFDFNDVVDTVCEKLIRRHPHVFADVDAKDSQAVLRNWEIIKRLEKKDEAANNEESVISGIPNSLPSLMRATKLQSKASRVGFDWNNVNDAMKKVDEEIDEFKEAFSSNEETRMAEELGDAIFSLVNVARLLKVDPEEALRHTCDRFSSRFKYIEKMARLEGRKIEDMTLGEMDKHWEDAKKAAKKTGL